MEQSKIAHLKQFLSNPQGSKWRKINLHVHASGQNPDEIVEAAIKAGIHMIAITDHNTFKFVRSVQEAASKRTDADLIVLPGIEITLEEGAHIIAIFDTDFDETKQTLFLGALGFDMSSTSKNAVKDKTCSQVLTRITDDKGITVVPHPYTKNIGLLDSARKIPTKMEWLESGNIGLTQIKDEDVKFIDFNGNGIWQNRYVLSTSRSEVITSTDYCLAPITPSESKTPSEIENGAVWLKLGSRTVRGLRQVTCEPRICISKDPPQDLKTFKLLGMTVEGGFFDGLQVGFSKDFTCIIGENHSGKTAIFDFISFAFGRDQSILGLPGREEELNLLLRRLNAILQPNSEVDLFLTRNGFSYCVSRTFLPEFDTASNVIGIQTNPEVLKYDPDRDELIPVDFKDIAVLPEIYTQGHVGFLKESVKSQLFLIDDLAGLAEHQKIREEIKKKLRDNADKLADLYEQKEVLTGTVGALSQLKQELQDNEKHLVATDDQKWQSSASLINNAKNRIEQLDISLDHRQKSALANGWKVDQLDFVETDVAHPELLNSIAAAINTYNISIDAIFLKLEESVKTIQKSCKPSFDKWDEKFTKHKKLASMALRQKGFDSPEQLLDKVGKLRSKINKIEKRSIPQLRELEKEISTLSDIRDRLRKTLLEISATIARSREAKIDELNKIVGPDIKISLEKPDPQGYIDLLEQVCTEISSKDRKIHRRDEQLSLVAYSVTPPELVEAVLNDGTFKDKDRKSVSLVRACGITQNTQEVLCSIKGFFRSLHKLQVFEAEPVPKILVKREGTDKFADLRTGLSPGEQSSTILALALMARDVPLIIDQPEDELGYSYIVNKIVPKILKAKTERQVILISHNANIPVLADAEFIVKIRNDPVESQSRCSIEQAGTFAQESVCNKLLELEGGERAFQIRQYRYAIPRRVGI
jgi:DNA repair ATPase RecN